jgi:hypothetical protein
VKKTSGKHNRLDARTSEVCVSRSPGTAIGATSSCAETNAPLFAVSFHPPENPGNSTAHFSYLFARAYEGDQGLEGLERLSPMHEVKTLFLTQSLLPLVQLWGGRLRLDGFTSTLHIENVQLGPSAGAALQDSRLSRQSYPGAPRSVDLYGISLNFHLGGTHRLDARHRYGDAWRGLLVPLDSVGLNL